MRLHTAFLTSLLRRHLFGMGLTASALSTAPAAKGAIRYRQLWVSEDGVTHIDEQECGKLETKDFTSTGGDAALQYVRAFSASDDFALTGLVVTQQVGENPWHYCPSRAGAVSHAIDAQFRDDRPFSHSAIRRDARGKLVHPHERWQDDNF